MHCEEKQVMFMLYPFLLEVEVTKSNYTASKAMV